MAYVVKVERAILRSFSRFGRDATMKVPGWVHVDGRRHLVRLMAVLSAATIFKTKEEAEGVAVFVAAREPQHIGDVKVRKVVFHKGRDFTTTVAE